MTDKMLMKAEGRELILERVFDAPRKLVFEAFTKAEHLKQWWGPRGWEVTVCNVDFRPGGVWHYCMKCMDEKQGSFYGMESWGKAVYEEITEGESFVYVDCFSDAEGNVNTSLPSTRIKLIFEELDGKTKVVNHAFYDSEEALKTVLEMGMEQGIRETWDRLAEHLQSAK